MIIEGILALKAQKEICMQQNWYSRRGLLSHLQIVRAKDRDRCECLTRFQHVQHFYQLLFFYINCIEVVSHPDPTSVETVVGEGDYIEG